MAKGKGRSKGWRFLCIADEHVCYVGPEGELAKLPNVYAKVSHVLRRVNDRAIENPKIYRPRLDLLWELFGPDRVVFGSNWPVGNRLAPYASVHQVVADYVGAKGRAAAEKYFWKNSLAAYSWRPRGKAAKLARKK